LLEAVTAGLIAESVRLAFSNRGAWCPPDGHFIFQTLKSVIDTFPRVRAKQAAENGPLDLFLPDRRRGSVTSCVRKRIGRLLTNARQGEMHQL
jgi:hypothetical protein